MRLSAVLLCLLLASCKVGTTAVTPAKASPKAQTTSGPVGIVEPGPASPTPKPVASVARLDSVALSGHITLDAGYIVAQGGGNIVAQGGGNIVAQGGGNIVAQGGGNIVAQGGGNVISAKQDPAALGSQLIGNDGAGAVAAVSAGLITNDGGSLITNDGGSWHLLDVATSSALPAAGMAVQAINLSTGRPILMVDGKGRVGKWVLSDASGAYQLFIPRSLEGNVLIQAQPPAKLADPRLRLTRLANASQVGEVAVDEPSTLAVAFCRNILISKITPLLFPGLETTVQPTNLTPEQRLILETLRKQLDVSLQAGDAGSLDDHQRKALAIRCSDVVLAKLHFGELKIDRLVEPFAGPDEPALAAIDGVLRKVQDKVRAKLDGDPAFFTTLVQAPLDRNPVHPEDARNYLQRYNDWVKVYNAANPKQHRDPYDVKTPADIGAFIGEAYLASNDVIQNYVDGGKIFEGIEIVLRSLDDKESQFDSDRLRAGINGVAQAVGLQFAQQIEEVGQIVAGSGTPEARKELSAMDITVR
ncbi:MAG: hypothetical protein JWM80_5436 [Cyanobacteria bacterium RYN_339]|nr:hypothetical protein [Cyanobacteria bacterium RYN_339]